MDTSRPTWCRLAGGLLGSVLAALLCVAVAGTAQAVPPPPPNPSDRELDAGRTEAREKAGEVGRLTNRLAELDGQLLAAQAETELKRELANKARVDLAAAEKAALAAKRAAESAATEARAAAQAIEDARGKVDHFASGSYQQGAMLGSMSAFLGARSPQDVLDRAHLLNAISGSQLNAIEELERARVNQANADSAARAALQEARAKRAAAERAKRDTDAAYAEAMRASDALTAQLDRIDAEKADVERELASARATVSGLEGQRERYQEWAAAKQREEEERARRAAEDASSGGPARPGPRPPASGSVSTVINRALSQQGVPYAWGGGNAHGPTRGIRDGGVADRHGDYNKIGFDCSGLMIYAFAGAGIPLPHYSGYQYRSGPRVPLAQRRPGDMLFWATGGRIHHVALYLGNGMMVEAPYSGSYVRVTPVRYAGIVPYVTRLL